MSIKELKEELDKYPEYLSVYISTNTLSSLAIPIKNIEKHILLVKV